MGFHVCECNGRNKDTDQFPYTSSGDVTLIFASGRAWIMPDMILHYVADHGWQPPGAFVSDVMRSEYTGGNRVQTRGVDSTTPTPVGYLKGEIARGPVPDGFVVKLAGLMKRAESEGQRAQTKDIPVYR